MNKRAFASLFFALFVLAAFLRTARLGLRPMHHDEANQAVKFGQLLEEGKYRYDPADHHGPSLYYITLHFVEVLSGGSFADLTESDLRLVTAAFGLGTMLLLLLFVPLIGRAATIWAALALAVSPAMVYFSRFYIQETLLVFFIVGFVACLWRYLRRPGWGWAVGAGLCAGMMYATKETSVIAFAAMAASLAAVRPWESAEHEDGTKPGKGRVRWFHGLIAVGLALGVAFIFFSSFLRHPFGFLDSLAAFKGYFHRAAEPGAHGEPWFYYFAKLLFSRGHRGTIWTEALVIALALAGAVAAFRAGKRRGIAGAAFMRFTVLYSAIAAVLYSAIPYKTPWNLLPFYIGFIVAAGIGAAFLVSLPKRRLGRLLVAVLLAAGFIHLASQAYRQNFRYPADERNPYVYAQTSPDFLRLVRRVEELARYAPARRAMLIKVVAGPYETWPLPWYLRGFSRVGYWTSAAHAGDIGRPAVVISSTGETAALEPALSTAFRSEYYGLRPGVLLTLSIRNDLWEALMKERAR